MANPTTIAIANLTMQVVDSASTATIISHIMPPVSWKASNVQYQGYLNIPVNSFTSFGPLFTLTPFGVVFVRNIGGQGAGNVALAMQATGASGPTTVANLDVGAMFLYMTPLLASTTVSTIQPGIVSVQLTSSTITSSNLEILLAL